MESTKIILSGKKPAGFTGDLLIYHLNQSKRGKLKCANKTISALLKKSNIQEEFLAEEGDTLLLYPGVNDGGTGLSARCLLFLGLGKNEDTKSEEELRESCRKLGGLIAAEAERIKAGNIAVCLPAMGSLSPRKVIQCLSEGILLGDYRFIKYKKTEKKDKVFKGIQTITFIVSKTSAVLRKGMRDGAIAAHASCTARNMANEPGNGWRASDFAAHARKLARKTELKCSILNKSDMKRLGMGGILAVNQGSVEPPKMVILEYRPAKKNETLLFVGKGLTFDSGGVSLKPSAGMEDMKYDMCGGAAVLSFMEGVAREKPDVGVVAIIPSTDNMAGGGALKPGDIIRHYSGVTAEIVNTDAEGRLILADGLAYGIKRFKPAAVIDLATLTGAVIVSLGHHRTGLLGNNQKLIERLLSAGEKSGEPLWQLPLGAEYSKQIESRVADIKNTGGRGAGTITAAAYLEKFVGETPWAHLDIAGTAWNFTKKSYIPKGPSGTGVRTLLEFVRSWKKGSLG